MCGKCSSKKSNLAYDNNRPNRVCDKCFSILKNVDGKEVDQKAPKGVKKVSDKAKGKGQQIGSKVRVGEKLIPGKFPILLCLEIYSNQRSDKEYDLSILVFI